MMRCLVVAVPGSLANRKIFAHDYPNVRGREDRWQ